MSTISTPAYLKRLGALGYRCEHCGNPPIDCKCPYQEGRDGIERKPTLRREAEGRI